MTKEQAREDTWDIDYQIGVMQAFKARRQIELRLRDRPNEAWQAVVDPKWDWYDCEYRIKHTPTLRPWTADEVPLGAWLRYKGNAQSIRLLIVSNTELGLAGYNTRWEYKTLLKELEHSLDGGKTWLPCGVEEEVK